MLLNRYLRFLLLRWPKPYSWHLCWWLAWDYSLHRANHAFSEGAMKCDPWYQSILRKDPGNVQARNVYRRAAPLAATGTH